MGDNAPYVVFYVLAAVFVASGLIGRRIPLGQGAKMGLAWLAIFGLAFAIFAFRDDFSRIGQRLRAEITGAPIVEGETVRIPISEDGHFWVRAKINGESVRFMVDSGASITTISRQTAEAAGIAIGREKAVVSTANGPAWVTKATARRLELGSIARSDFPIDVSEQEDMNLLGMNFLSTLSSWRVEGNMLVLQP
jgi:aspartyl protease family protein